LNEAANICKKDAENQKNDGIKIGSSSNAQTLAETNILDLKDQARERAIIEHSLRDFVNNKGKTQ
jgi:hypothetical protein